MTNKGNINRLVKSINNRQSSENTSENFGHARGHLPTSKRENVIVEALNSTGDIIPAYSCVILIDGDICSMDYPAAEDAHNSEITQYGSVLEDVLDGEVGHVQISGELLFRLKSGSELVVVGEILYPLNNDNGFGGMVTNKASNNADRINLPVGRSLESEGTDNEYITVSNSGVGGSSGADIEVADYCSTTNIISKTGIPTIDNSTPAVENIIFLQNQLTPTENGLWSIPSNGGTWTQINDAPDVVFIKGGNANSLSIWIRKGDNTFYRYDNTVLAATSGNRTLSGIATTNLDGISAPSVGDLILVWKQTAGNESQHGLYVVQSGSWIKLGQPNNCIIRTGTLYGGVTLFLSSSNTYTGGKAVYG